MPSVGPFMTSKMHRISTGLQNARQFAIKRRTRVDVHGDMEIDATVEGLARKWHLQDAADMKAASLFQSHLSGQLTGNIDVLGREINAVDLGIRDRGPDTRDVPPIPHPASSIRIPVWIGVEIQRLHRGEPAGCMKLIDRRQVLGGHGIEVDALIR